ncbi:MAG: O-antigen ligase family protein [Peptococcaceae bacterium]|nr:O-antigen ligase family protein [Peptococcaceae bacterium]
MIWNHGITAKNETRLFLLVVTILSVMILPPFSLHPSLPKIRLEELLLFMAFGINILLLIINKFRFSEEQKREIAGQKKQFKTICLIFALLVASYAVSNFYGVYIRGAGYYGLRDVMELVTYFKYFLLITLALSVDIGKEEFDFLKKAVLAGLVFLLVFGWGQNLNLFNLNTWLSPYFNQQHWDTLIYGNPARVLGTFDNPNYFGMFTVIVLSYLTVRYYFGEDKGKFPLLLLILIGLVIKLEFLTISRTALLGIALLFIILSIWALRYYKWEKKILIKIGALFLLTAVLFLTASADFFYRLQEGLNFQSSTSFIGHVERWGKAIGSIWESPVFGWGTQKYVMTTLVDNEYALFARRYGFVGLAVYLSFFLVPFVLGFKKLAAKGREWGRGAAFDLPTQFVAAYVAVLPSVFVFNFMGGILYHLQLMTVFAISMGLVYNALRNGRENNDYN